MAQPLSLKQRIRSALREVFSRAYEPRKAVMARAARYKPAYNKDGSLSKRPNKFTICSVCSGEFKDTEIQCDHRQPVGNTPEWPCKPGEWEAWMGRLFCGEEGLRAICKTCHLGISKPQWTQLREERIKDGKKHKLGRIRREAKAKSKPDKGSNVAKRKSSKVGRSSSKPPNRRGEKRTG